MPETHFLVRWPGGREERCYSPSLIVREYLEVGGVYRVSDFRERSRVMVNIASDRVKTKYGFFCSAAMDQFAKLEARGASYRTDAQVTVLGFDLGSHAEA